MRYFGLQFRNELLKLFARKRTYIGFGVFLLTEILLLLLASLPVVQRSMVRTIERSGYIPDEFLSGPTLALQVVVWSIFLLGSLYLAMVSGDLVAKESEDGTLRMTLCRPVSRLRVLTLKALAGAVYTLTLVAFVTLGALAVGVLHSGTGNLFVFIPTEGLVSFFDSDTGMRRYFLAIPFLALSLMTISAIGFFFSCMNIKPAAATVLTLSVFLVDMILKNVPYFEDIQQWFITSRMNAWSRVFEYTPPWEMMTVDYLWLIAVNSSLFIAGWAIFERRDFKS